MEKEPSPLQARDLAFLIVGVMDAIFGVVFILVWLDLLPLVRSFRDLPRWLASSLGLLLSLSGVIVVTYQLTKLKGPDR
jgi:hypothetical protein